MVRVHFVYIKTKHTYEVSKKRKGIRQMLVFLACSDIFTRCRGLVEDSERKYYLGK